MRRPSFQLLSAVLDAALQELRRVLGQRLVNQAVGGREQALGELTDLGEVTTSSVELLSFVGLVSLR